MEKLLLFIKKLKKPVVAIEKINEDYHVLAINEELQELNIDLDHLLKENGSFQLFCRDLFKLNENLTESFKTLNRNIKEGRKDLELYGFLFDENIATIQVNIQSVMMEKMSANFDGAAFYKAIASLQGKMDIIQEEVDDQGKEISDINLKVQMNERKIAELFKGLEVIKNNDFLCFTQNIQGWKKAAIIILILFSFMGSPIPHEVVTNFLTIIRNHE